MKQFDPAVWNYIRSVPGSEAQPSDYIAIDNAALNSTSDVAAESHPGGDFLELVLPCGLPSTAAATAGQELRPVAPRLTLHMDLHRTGHPDAPVEGEVEWTSAAGAVVLFNNDRELPFPNGLDHEDEYFACAADAPDIARIRLVKEPPEGVFPPGWRGVLSFEPESRAHFFINYMVGERACVRSGRPGPVTVELETMPHMTDSGLEALGYARSMEERDLFIGLEVYNAEGELQSHGITKVRIAPWIMCHHLMPIRQTYVVNKHVAVRPPRVDDDGMEEDPHTQAYALALSAALGETVRPLLIKTDDNWVRDMFYNGYSMVPGGEALLQVVVCPSERAGRSGFEQIGAAVQADHAGPGCGYAAPIQQRDAATDLDSGGNFLCAPPIPNHPFGRIIHGEDASRPVSKDLMAFFRAQGVQAPLAVDTSWLQVGHVDEVLTFIPWPQGSDTRTQSRHGFRVLLASHHKAMALVKKAPANRPLFRLHAGREAELARHKMLEGMRDYSCGSMRDCALLTEIADEVEGHLDRISATLRAALHLGEHDVVKVPVLFVRYGSSESQRDELEAAAKPSPLAAILGGKAVQKTPAEVRKQFAAYTPNVVNMLVATADDGSATLCIPQPHGPASGTNEHYRCSFEAYIGMVLEGSGNRCVFIDDFDAAHLKAGEIHCTTFEVRKVPKPPDWWTYEADSGSSASCDSVPLAKTAAGGREKESLPSNTVENWLESLNTLNTGQYLDDAILERYYGVLRQRYIDQPYFFIDPSVSYMMAMGDENDAVLTLADMTQGEQPEIVFFPVNNNCHSDREGGSHWTLIVYYPTLHKFDYYDSLNNPPDAAAIWAHRRLQAMFHDQAAMMAQRAPQQSEAECGAYVLALSDALAQRYTGPEDKWNKLFGLKASELRGLIRQDLL